MNQAIAVIPTTGAPELEMAVRSVLDQTVATDVLVAFDGAPLQRELALPDDPRVHRIILPFNTGRGRTHLLPEGLPRHWYGARAQIACSYMVNHDFCFVLDQDNWLEPDHVESCLATLNAPSASTLGFVHAYRNVHRKDGSFVCRDECESLGVPGGLNGPLIDTSCYFYRTDFLLQTAHWWLAGWGSDRVYLARVRQSLGDSVFAPTHRFTVNYRLGGNPGSVTEAFFVEGNRRIREQAAAASAA